MKTVSRKGFSLLELILVLGVGSAFTLIKFQDMKNTQEQLRASAVGSQIKQVGEAVNGYINIRYAQLASLGNAAGSGTDPGPRTCSPDGLCVITPQTLINEGLLPVTYVAKNGFGSDYTIQLKRTGNAPNYVIDGLITTDKAWSEGGRIRYDMLGKAMQVAGIDSGMSKTKDRMNGYSNGWNYTSPVFTSINQPGILGFRVGYNSSMYSVYLRRDGTLPMTGDLNMGGQNIRNINNITATDDVTGTTLRSSGDTQVGGVLDVGGASTLNGQVSVNSGLKVKSATYLNTLSTTGSAEFGGRVATNGLDPGDIPAGWGGGIRTFDLYASGTIGVGSGKNVLAYMNSAGNIFTSGNITAGTIKTNGTIESAGRVKVGEYLYLNGQATANAGCTPDGLVGRDSSGKVLSCVKGRWSDLTPVAASGIFVTNSNRYNPCTFPNRATGACSCSPGLKDIVISKTGSTMCSGGNNSHCSTYYTYFHACA